jgi:hypothetical protein
MGYTGGSSVLDSVLRHNLDLARPAGPGDVRHYLVDQVFNITIGKLFLAALLVPIDQDSAPRFLRIYEKFQATEQQRLERSRPSNPVAMDIAPNVAAMMDGLKDLLPARPAAPTASATREDGGPESPQTDSARTNSPT